MSHYYRAFGLNICFEFPCPILVENNSGSIDVRISLGEVPEKLISNDGADDWCQANNNQLLLKIPNVAKFLVENGNSIIVELQSDDIDYMCVFLMGSAFGGLLHQRGRLVMHANAVMIKDRAILVSAPRGYGKSTLAGAFLKCGYPLLSDDVCAIEILSDKAVVYPGYPQIKLCADVIAPLGYDSKKLKPIGHKTNKYYLPIAEHFYHEPIKISHMIFLDKGTDLSPSFNLLYGQEKMKALIDNSYRHFFLDMQGLTPYFFKQCADLIKKISFIRLSRPQTSFTAFDLVNIIVSFVNNKEKTLYENSY